MNDDFVVTAVGDTAVIVRFEERIDPVLNARVRRLAEAVGRAAPAGLRDIVPSFHTVTFHFDPLRMDVVQLVELLQAEIDRDPGAVMPPAAPPREIPVCYGGEFGPDLRDLAAWCGLSESNVVDAHSSPTYRVYMLGFVPGFAYLASVDPRIAMPRRRSPRLSVPAGSVAIAGQQTGVYPTRTPGGWNVIGRTPLRMFDATRSAPSLLSPGDAVVFRAIDSAEFARQSEDLPA